MNKPEQRLEGIGFSFKRGCELERQAYGFTILELVTVIVIMLLLAALAIPTFNSVQEAFHLTNSTSQIASLLEQARAYAMANNTFVWVAFKETDAAQSPTETPQLDGIGRIAILVVASRDGTRGYDVLNPAKSWSASYEKTNGSNLIIINKLTRFDNLHMAASLGITPEKGPMGLEAGREDVGRFYRLGHPACRSLTPINYPLGSNDRNSDTQYQFSKVLYFDPRGIARIQYASNGDEIKEWMEIGLEATHENLLPKETLDPSRGRKSAVQIDCMTGSIRIYTP